MSTRNWLGRGPKIAQVTDFVLAGTWLANETITFTIGTVSYTMTVGSTSIPTILDNMIAAWNTTIDATGEYPSFDELTATEDGSDTFTLTMDDAGAGKPFTVTISTNSASGTIDSGSSSAGSNSVENSGPNDWNTAANWTSADTPDTGDDVVIDGQSTDDILYGLDQNAVDLQSITVTAGFTGKIGLPDINQDGTAYFEYRQKDLKVGISGGTATVTLGNGEGTGSGRIRLDLDGATATVRQYSSGASDDASRSANQLTNLGSSSVVEVFGGDLDVSLRSGETCTIATLRVTEGTVRCGSGVTLTTLVQGDGTVELNGAATTITQTGGDLTIKGTGAYTTIYCGGDISYGSSGTITTLNLPPGGAIDFTADNRARTITNLNLYAQSGFNDPNETTTVTNGFVFQACGIEDLTTFEIGKGFTLTKS